jgi:hypothetical protein
MPPKKLALMDGQPMLMWIPAAPPTISRSNRVMCGCLVQAYFETLFGDLAPALDYERNRNAVEVSTAVAEPVSSPEPETSERCISAGFTTGKVYAWTIVDLTPWCVR